MSTSIEDVFTAIDNEDLQGFQQKLLVLIALPNGVHLLSHYVAHAKTPGDTVLIRAVHEPHRGDAYIEALLAAGADPNVPSTYGCTPLYRCCELPPLEVWIRCAEILLENSADPMFRGPDGTSCLQKAALSGRHSKHSDSMTRLLRAFGATE